VLWGASGRVYRQPDPDRKGYFLYDLADVDRQLAAYGVIDVTSGGRRSAQTPTLPEARAEFPDLPENFLRKYWGRHCPVLGKRGPKSILRKVRTRRQRLNGWSFYFPAFARSQLVKIDLALRLAHDTKNWMTAAEVWDIYKINATILLKWHHDGCHYLGRKLKARHVWSIDARGRVMELWQFRREDVEAVVKGMKSAEDPSEQPASRPLAELAEKLGVNGSTLRQHANDGTLTTTTLASRHRQLGHRRVLALDPQAAADLARRITLRKAQPFRNAEGWWIPIARVAELSGRDLGTLHAWRNGKGSPPLGIELQWNQKKAWVRGWERDVFYLHENAARGLCGKRKIDLLVSHAEAIEAADAKRAAEQAAPVAKPHPAGAASTPARRRRGRPAGPARGTDPEKDRRIAEAWETGEYPTKAAVGLAFDILEDDVRLAIDRHRKARK
jgi:hypothetical protein